MTTAISNLGDHVLSRLRVIEGLAHVLMENHSLRDDKQRGFELQLDFKGESAIQEAVQLLAEQAQDQLIRLMNAAGGAQ